MFQKICADILNQKWAHIEQTNFPLNAKKITAIEDFSNSIKQFFFTEINYYCSYIIKSLTKNTNISLQLLNNEDSEHLTNILYDWVEFNREQTHLILENAIQTELFFLINPAKCLSTFLYRKNGDLLAERKIDKIIKEFDFITDNQNIISSLTEELLELANTKETLSDIEFNNLANDVVFNVIQGMKITELLSPLKSIQEILCTENIPLAIIDLFFYEYDLAGILTKIREYAINNERESLNYYEIMEIINVTLNTQQQIENIGTTIDLEEFVENVESEVDNTINEMGIEENKIEINEEGKTDTNDIESTTEIENKEEASNPEIYSQKIILYELTKMRTDGLEPIQRETIYLEMESQFLINFKNKLSK